MPFVRVKVIARPPGGTRSIALGRTGRWLAVERQDGHIEILDLSNDQLTATLDPLPAPTEHGGQHYRPLSFWGQDTTFVRLTQLPGDQAETIELVRLPNVEIKRVRLTHKGMLNNFSLSSDGRLLATSAWDGNVKLWDTRTGAEIHTFGGQLAGYISLAFAPDGLRLVESGIFQAGFPTAPKLHRTWPFSARRFA